MKDNFLLQKLWWLFLKPWGKAMIDTKNNYIFVYERCFSGDAQQFIFALWIWQDPCALAAVTISEMAGLRMCWGWNVSLVMSGVHLALVGTFWAVKLAGVCNVMTLPVVMWLNFMQVIGSASSARLTLMYKVKHVLCVFEELLPKADLLTWKELIMFFRDTCCLSLRSMWPGWSCNADGFCYQLTWKAKAWKLGLFSV